MRFKVRKDNDIRRTENGNYFVAVKRTNLNINRQGLKSRSKVENFALAVSQMLILHTSDLRNTCAYRVGCLERLRLSGINVNKAPNFDKVIHLKNLLTKSPALGKK